MIRTDASDPTILLALTARQIEVLLRISDWCADLLDDDGQRDLREACAELRTKVD